jgi:hypothetical protein
MAKLTKCKLNLEPKNSGILSRVQYLKNQAIKLMNSDLYLFIHCLCAEFALCLGLYVQVKFTLSFMVQEKQLCAAS